MGHSRNGSYCNQDVWIARGGNGTGMDSLERDANYSTSIHVPFSSLSLSGFSYPRCKFKGFPGLNTWYGSWLSIYTFDYQIHIIFQYVKSWIHVTLFGDLAEKGKYVAVKRRAKHRNDRHWRELKVIYLLLRRLQLKMNTKITQSMILTAIWWIRTSLIMCVCPQETISTESLTK